MSVALYEIDFYAWLNHQANALQSEEFGKLDLDHLIEELQVMARSEKRQIANRLRVLLAHLLKLTVESNRDPMWGWRATVRDQRHRFNRLLVDNPSLRLDIRMMIQTA